MKPKYWVITIVLIVAALAVGYGVWKNKQKEDAPKCGGIAGFMCPEGYTCTEQASYPDAMGYCVKTSK